MNSVDLVISLGRGAYEAMACGRPVVVADVEAAMAIYTRLCLGVAQEQPVWTIQQVHRRCRLAGGEISNATPPRWCRHIEAEHSELSVARHYVIKGALLMAKQKNTEQPVAGKCPKCGISCTRTNNKRQAQGRSAPRSSYEGTSPRSVGHSEDACTASSITPAWSSTRKTARPR